MKKIFLLTVVFFTMLSCSKDEGTSSSNSSISDIPLAQPEYDNSNYGVYKGVFVGSSGIVYVNIKNNDNNVTAKFIINGVTYDFISNQIININSSTSINFSNGQSSFTISVNSNGSNPVISNLLFANHPNANVVIVKEKSNLLVRCFEGTYSGSETGVFNSVIYGNQIIGLVKNSQNNFFVANGNVVNNQIGIGNVNTGASFSGIFNGNSCSGTWINTQFNLSGTWSGIRTY